MTFFDQDLVLIGTPAQWAAEQAACAAVGYGLSDGVPLSGNGAEPATHRGTLTRVTAAMAAHFAAGGLIVSVNPATGERGRAHLDLVLANNNLQIVTTPEV